MRILNNVKNERLDNVIVFLTRAEAIELRDSLNNIIDKTSIHHEHVSSDDYQKEITVCIYNPEHLANFDERSKKLILEDK